MKYLLTVLLLVSAIGIYAETYTAVTDDFEPFYGAKIRDNGFFTQLIAESFKAVGHDLQYNWMPWKRAITQAENVQFDILIGAYYSEERTKIFEYSDAISSAQVVLFERKGSNIKYSTLNDLAKYKIGVVYGYANTEEFDNADYLTKESSSDSEASLKLLLNKRVDLICNSREVILHILQNSYPDSYSEISVVQPPLKVNDLHILVSKKNPKAKKIIGDFNKGLKIIKENGTYDKILEKYGMK